VGFTIPGFIPGKSKNFVFLLQNAQISPGTHPGYEMGTECSFSGVK
jgi:hypothetical protein